MAELPREIRGVMIPVTGGRVLLPNATVAEVITYSAPERVDGAPAWLLGRLGWRGWRLPLFSFPILAGHATEESTSNARVTVLKALGGSAKMPFIAMLAQGFPRLTTVTQDLLLTTGDHTELAPGVRAEVLVRDDHAVIPDLGAIEAMVAEAMAA
ncbi:chemotaxis protein CheW [Dokdonella sp. MW10]|uniref:chemotaxis protein CheW n=1 Tax=Dokdonella sp. MW10 TaxID=2992926 RepID=UPI003F7E928F